MTGSGKCFGVSWEIEARYKKGRREGKTNVLWKDSETGEKFLHVVCPLEPNPEASLEPWEQTYVPNMFPIPPLCVDWERSHG